MIEIRRRPIDVDAVNQSRHSSPRDSLTKSASNYARSFLGSLFPPVDWVRSYKKRYLPGDVISGLTVSMIRLPQGLAYGLLAGLAPINGVYLEFFQCFVYSLLSTVPQNSMGTFSIISLMSGSVLDSRFPTSTNLTTNGEIDPFYAEKVEMSTALTLGVGLFHAAFGLFNLGALSILLPKPVVGGFTTASAIIVSLAQATHIFGFPIARHSGFAGPLLTIGEVFKGLTAGLVTWSSLIISLISIPILYAGKMAQIKYKEKLNGFPIPVELALVAVTTTIFYFVDSDVKVVGEVPGGLPEFKLPRVELLGDLAFDAFAMAIVSYATTLSLGKIFASKRGFTFSPNQEGLALGAAHLVSSCFACFPGSAALARSSLQESAGGNTHLASLVSALFMFIIIVWIGPIFRTLPRSVLSCIVIVNLRSMFLQFQQLPSMWRETRPDCLVWLSSFFGVMLFGVVGGLACGVMALMASLLFSLINQSQLRPIGQFDTSEYYFDNTDQSEIYEFAGPLNFATAENLRIETPKGTKNALLKKELIIVMGKVSGIDLVGGNALVSFLKGKNAHLVDVPPHVRRRLDGEDGLGITYHATVIDARHCLSGESYATTEKC